MHLRFYCLRVFRLDLFDVSRYSFDSSLYMNNFYYPNYNLSNSLVWLVFHVSSLTSISGYWFKNIIIQFYSRGLLWSLWSSVSARLELDYKILFPASRDVLPETKCPSQTPACASAAGWSGGPGLERPSLPSFRCLQYNELVLIFLSTTAWAVTLAGCPLREPPRLQPLAPRHALLPPPPLPPIAF